MVSLLSLAVVDPALEMAIFATIALAVAFMSATQDIVIDAYRIESAEVRLQCSPGEPSYLAKVEEVATCEYVVHFSTNLICKHPGFAADESKEEVQAVQCEPPQSTSA